MKSEKLKFILLLSLLFQPILLIGQGKITNYQDWFFYESGNPIDGKVEIAGVSSLEDKDLMLGIQNYSNTKNINYNKSFTEFKGGVESIWISIKTPSLNFKETKTVKMYFDDDNFFFYLNFIKIKNGISLQHAYSPKAKSFLETPDIVKKFKTKNKVTIRLEKKNSHKDYSFSLKGSTAAIKNIITSISPNPQANKLDFDPISLALVTNATISTNCEEFQSSDVVKIFSLVKQKEIYLKYGNYWTAWVKNVTCEQVERSKIFKFFDSNDELLTVIDYTEK
ncbi:MAG: hypothetical protein P8K77_05835 [Polaribacter sp.]|nr:hypothetical protein [Polaribacter sp.]